MEGEIQKLNEQIKELTTAIESLHSEISQGKARLAQIVQEKNNQIDSIGSDIVGNVSSALGSNDLVNLQSQISNDVDMKNILATVTKSNAKLALTISSL